MLTLGYIKDFIACILFLVAIFIVFFIKDLNVLKGIILLCLFFGFLVDGLFSIQSSYHGEYIGYNVPTYSVFILVILYTFLILYLFQRSNQMFNL